MSELNPAQIKDAVDQVLTRNRLPVTPEEYEWLLRNYSTIQSQLQELRLPEVRYAEPAVVFTAATHR